ncbi:hypothetical protein EVAR_70712_1 [Eumeta japonica]|uniref:Uncharacterized protein n=1 Tax=Eumeta variegata TaxID=151549 RepID=A0A4C1SEM3_EUMVA|nr:hypothetical protein EVAR_70712_1 [Eumeta japonica]
MKPGFVNTIRNLNRVHAMDEKGETAEKFKVQKLASKLMATIFWDSEGTRGSRTEATWEVIARSAVLQDNASVHTARVSRQTLKDTGFSKLTTHLTARSSSATISFSNLKRGYVVIDLLVRIK